MSYIVHCDGTINLKGEYAYRVAEEIENEFKYYEYCNVEAESDTRVEIHISGGSVDDELINMLDEKYFDIIDSGEIYCRGEDSELWRHVFEGGSWWLENAVITYERDPNGWV